MQDFRKLLVWQAAHQLTLAVYEATAGLPAAEAFGLRAQARRAATSIPANIAEGCGRDGPRELARFLYLALGSASELEYHLLLARDLRLVAQAQHDRLALETAAVKRMLAGLARTVKSKPKTDN